MEGQSAITSPKVSIEHRRYDMYRNSVKHNLYRGTSYASTMSEKEAPCARLRRARRDAGYESAAAAARAFGWEYETYKKTESGERALTRDKAIRYGGAFHKRPAWLMLAEGEEDAILTPKEGALLARFRGLPTHEQDLVFDVCDRLYKGHEFAVDQPNGAAKKGA